MFSEIWMRDAISRYDIYEIWERALFEIIHESILLILSIYREIDITPFAMTPLRSTAKYSNSIYPRIGTEYRSECIEVPRSQSHI
jgi:hypothetical protein